MVERTRSQKPGNAYTRTEWAGAFGDLGTLIPFAVAYIMVVGVDPAGLLFMFGVSKIAAGLYYRTPMPIQPMKAIGAAAIAGGVSPAMIFGAGLTTGVFWLVMGATGAIRFVTAITAKPVVRGIMLGLGLSFMADGINRMQTAPVLAIVALAITFLLLNHSTVPAMFVLLIMGVIAALMLDPSLAGELRGIRIAFTFPAFTLHGMTWNDLLKGTLLFTIPQIPLTIGNAVIAITAENNQLFPDRPVSERKIALSTGLMNLLAPLFGGVPMCHGAGGMAGHVRFGARSGGALVILGVLVSLIALFFSESISIFFRMVPPAILGVILFFAGAELAVVVRDIGDDRNDWYIMLVVAALAVWNMGVAFLAGIVLCHVLKCGIVEV
ncbi:MAG TPA: putative sulfate/molybdate transporter [Thermodesulfobacteriota bacterium]|nr:putative sulfate/molybdate transporter [Thermodesulfobacteriota bacterium]